MMKIVKKILLYFTALFLLFSLQQVKAQSEVLIIICSDTAIWDGMDCSRFNCTYKFDVYTDPAGNAYKVMEPSFRDQCRDSYGHTVKCTWYMMGGNMYRFATNQTVPLANTMVLHLMKQYHEESIKKFGDELSLHYHTFAWTDYDKNGVFYWNQAEDFNECREDFNTTLAQYLLEENIYPVTFRSGWHYMDNHWQNYIDSLIPLCVHNDYPNKNTDLSEPRDNNYDWSKCSSEFVPFHPSKDNYQLPGNLKTLTLRSKSMGSFTQNIMDAVFSKAHSGVNQVIGAWAHLPETDFLDNIKKITTLAASSSAKYGVKFRFCTATEALQLWKHNKDTVKPEISIEKQYDNGKVKFLVKSNKPLFQSAPFFAVKDIYENYSVPEMIRTSENEWMTAESFDGTLLAKAAAAAVDTADNLTIRSLNLLPDDIYIDDTSNVISVSGGSSSRVTSLSKWNCGYTSLTIPAGDSVIIKTPLPVSSPGKYNLFILPACSTDEGLKITSQIFDGAQFSKKRDISSISDEKWIYAGYSVLPAAGAYADITLNNRSSAGKTFGLDAIKLSPLVKEKEITTSLSACNLGEISELDSALIPLTISNNGISQLTVKTITYKSSLIKIAQTVPFILDAMSGITVPLKFTPAAKGAFTDTLAISSDDPYRPVIYIPVTSVVKPYFTIADNDSQGSYTEEGTWITSVAQAYGQSSRCSYLNKGAGAKAHFKKIVKKDGYYDIFYILPVTVNSADKALYTVKTGKTLLDSVYLNQNTSSGTWIKIARHYFTAGTEVELSIINDGKSSSNAGVLRADAVKYQIIDTTSAVNDNLDRNKPTIFSLSQNFPNPFNPSTTIAYTVPEGSDVTIKLFDLLGRQRAVLVSGYRSAGQYSFQFSASDLASGIYIYRLEAGKFMISKKMAVLK
jgi:hypothetical protein